MSKIVRYDGPGHRLSAFGKVIDRGQEIEMSDGEVFALSRNPTIRFTVVDEVRRQPKGQAADYEESSQGGFEPEARRGEGQQTTTSQEV